MKAIFSKLWIEGNISFPDEYIKYFIPKNNHYYVNLDLINNLEPKNRYELLKNMFMYADLSMSKSSQISVAEFIRAKYARNLFWFIPPSSLISSMVNPHINFCSICLNDDSLTNTARLVRIWPADAVRNTYFSPL